MSGWQIRDADQTDASGIAEVHTHAWDAAYRGLLPDEVISSAASQRLSWWTSYLRRVPKRDQVIVAVEDGRIVGFASARPSTDDEATSNQAEIGGLYVEPEAWGQGIGGGLLQTLLDRLRSAALGRATLWVLIENASARRFYERRGWSPDGAERVDPHRRAPELRYRISLSPVSDRTREAEDG